MAAETINYTINYLQHETDIITIYKILNSKKFYRGSFIFKKNDTRYKYIFFTPINKNSRLTRYPSVM